jgi:ABC-type antimicrobial peptide transport system permease subunit
MILGQGFRMAVIGVMAGIAAVLLLIRMLPSFSNLLYGVGAYDPLTLIIVSTCMIVIALLACYLPARRAMRTDPMASLRCE